MIKLLAVDMDGTCLNSHSKISKATMKALEDASDAGIILVPTTGRALDCIPYQLKKQKNLYSYVITSNGAAVYSTLEKKDVYRKCIPDYMAEYFLEECETEKVGITAHVRHEYWIQGNLLSALGHAFFGKDAKSAKKVSSIHRKISDRGCSVEEIQLYFLPGSHVERIKKVLESYPELTAAYTDMYVEIFNRQTSKGNALKFLCEKLNIKKEEVACIGDGENDLTMFCEAGLKIAVGNAIDVLKEAADVVVDKNTKDGVAQAITEHILNQKSCDE